MLRHGPPKKRVNSFAPPTKRVATKIAKYASRAACAKLPLSRGGRASFLLGSAWSDGILNLTPRTAGGSAGGHRWPALVGGLCIWAISFGRIPLLRFERYRHVMKISKFLSLAAALSGGLLRAPVSASACNGNGNCENAPGQNKHHGAPGPLVGAGPVGLVIGVGYGVYWLVKRRRRHENEI